MQANSNGQGAASGADASMEQAAEVQLPPLKIELRYADRLTSHQQERCQAAADRWSAVLRTSGPPLSVDGELIDGVVVTLRVGEFDSPNHFLGLSGPTHLRSDSGLPIQGIIELDQKDLVRQEKDGSLTNVLAHQLGHVLGFGSLWNRFKLLRRKESGPSLYYVGDAAMREYAKLWGEKIDKPVPVESLSDGLPRVSHWRELLLEQELMSNFVTSTEQPLSRLTLATFADLGYQVNYAAADAFELSTRMHMHVVRDQVVKSQQYWWCECQCPDAEEMGRA